VKGEDRERLRRLKNTIMGASHRLSIFGSSTGMPAAEALTLAELAADLAAAAQRLERLLSGLDADR
jgi:hypothetical protein